MVNGRRKDDDRPGKGADQEKHGRTQGISPDGGGPHEPAVEEASGPIPEVGSEGISAFSGPPSGGMGGRTWSLLARIMMAAAFAVLALAAFSFLAVQAAHAPVETVEHYLLTLNEGRLGEAWEMLHVTSRFKEEGDFEGYLSLMKERMDSVTGWKTHLSHLTGSRAYVDVELLRDGGGSRFRLGLRNDGKRWMIHETGSEEPYGGP